MWWNPSTLGDGSLVGSRDGMCILGWPCLSQPAMWSRGLYGTGGCPGTCLFCHLHPPFSTSGLTVFGSQDVPSRFVFDFVICFAHLKMGISVSSSLVVAEVSPAAYHRLLRAHVSFLCSMQFLQGPGIFVVFCVSLPYLSVERTFFVYSLWTYTYTIQETALCGCTPLAMQIYKIKHPVVFNLLLCYDMDMLYVTGMYCHRLMVFPSFCLFWLAVLTDLFLVFTAQLGQWQPLLLSFPALSCCHNLWRHLFFRPHMGFLDCFDCFLFQDVESSALLGPLTGSAVRDRSGRSELILWCSTAVCWLHC